MADFASGPIPLSAGGEALHGRILVPQQLGQRRDGCFRLGSHRCQLHGDPLAGPRHFLVFDQFDTGRDAAFLIHQHQGLRGGETNPGILVSKHLGEDGDAVFHVGGHDREEQGRLAPNAPVLVSKQFLQRRDGGFRRGTHVTEGRGGVGASQPSLVLKQSKKGQDGCLGVGTCAGHLVSGPLADRPVLVSQQFNNFREARRPHLVQRFEALGPHGRILVLRLGHPMAQRFSLVGRFPVRGCGGRLIRGPKRNGKDCENGESGESDAQQRAESFHGSFLLAVAANPETYVSGSQNLRLRLTGRVGWVDGHRREALVGKTHQFPRNTHGGSRCA